MRIEWVCAATRGRMLAPRPPPRTPCMHANQPCTRVRHAAAALHRTANTCAHRSDTGDSNCRSPPAMISSLERTAFFLPRMVLKPDARYLHRRAHTRQQRTVYDRQALTILGRGSLVRVCRRSSGLQVQQVYACVTCTCACTYPSSIVESCFPGLRRSPVCAQRQRKTTK